MQRTAAILATLVVALFYTTAALSKEPVTSDRKSEKTALSSISTQFRLKMQEQRDRVNDCANQLGRDEFNVSDRPAVGWAYRQWVRKLWDGRESKTCGFLQTLSDPSRAICHVFKSRCQEALRVVQCESRFDVNAQNGQYLGLFQMGDWERATYGHGSTAYAQAIAAYRYFVASGSDWSPWSCKPWY